MPVSNPASFRAEARWQRVCAVCGAAGSFHAHHVLPKHLLRRLKLPRYDTRGALRLCEHCHMQFEWGGPGKVEIAVRCLTDQNICYLYEVLGVTVVQLEGKYSNFDVDPRWHKHRMGECLECQLSLPTSQSMP
jgi:hypothetical protein